MKSNSKMKILFASVVAVISALSPLVAPRVLAQNAELQQKVTAVKEAAAANKQSLAHYQWQEQQSISIKGNVKDTKTFQVRLGPDGTPQKEELTNLPQS